LIEGGDSRSKIVKLISLHPGMHLRELQRALGLSFNSVRYNTELLAETGQVHCEKTRGHSRFFPPGMLDKDRALYSCARNNTTFRILQALSKEQQISSKTLSEVTGYAKSTISEHIHHLIDLELVRITLSTEGNFKVELLERERISALVSSELASRQGDFVENFADLWDF
jgi:predicted transcriptional regulator